MANILVGICGSIAAYKTIQYLRDLAKLGHQCKVILSPGGENFLKMELFAGLGFTVHTESTLKLSDPEQAMLHINLAKWAERFIIAPASANCIAKLAHGLADNLLCETALAYANSPIYLAPAMNQQMWHNLRTQANLELLRQAGFCIWQPAEGLQACGDSGPGRLPESNQLVDLTLQTLAKPDYAQQTLLLTLGATVEEIDPVRYISNHSSGKMGLALIKQALARGARVIAISGKMALPVPNHPNLIHIPVLSARQMLTESQKYASSADLFIACAAVADYRVAQPQVTKIKKTTESLTLELIKNPDIVSLIKLHNPQLLTIGFAAETENLMANAQQKLVSKGLDMIIANDVSNDQVFNQDNTQISIITATNQILNLAKSSKDSAAEKILNKARELLE